MSHRCEWVMDIRVQLVILSVKFVNSKFLKVAKGQKICHFHIMGPRGQAIQFECCDVKACHIMPCQDITAHSQEVKVGLIGWIDCRQNYTWLVAAFPLPSTRMKAPSSDFLQRKQSVVGQKSCFKLSDATVPRYDELF